MVGDKERYLCCPKEDCECTWLETVAVNRYKPQRGAIIHQLAAEGSPMYLLKCVRCGTVTPYEIDFAMGTKSQVIQQEMLSEVFGEDTTSRIPKTKELVDKNMPTLSARNLQDVSRPRQ